MLELPDDMDIEETDKASKLKGLVWIVAACLLGAVFGSGLAPLAHAVPWSWENSISRATSLPESAYCKKDPAAEAALEKIVKRLYPLRANDHIFSIDVRTVRNKEVNAYAGLGGKIVIYSGLLKQAQSPEEIAAIIAHEVEHVRHRHIMEGVITNFFTVQGLQIIFGDPSYADWTNIFLTMNFNRAQERQADRDGLARLQKARIDNKGFIKFFERMERDNPSGSFLSDHPDNKSRTDMAAEYPNAHVKPLLTKAEFAALKQSCP